MRTIIAISGKQRSGKDTLAAFLLKYLPDWKRVGLADTLKDEYCLEMGIDRSDIDRLKNHDAEIRKGLIQWGGMRRAENPDYWVQQVMAQAPNIIVPDVRFLNEAEAFRKADAYMLRVVAPKTDRVKRGVLCHEDDPSETELDAYPNFHVIQNDKSIAWLECHATDVVKMLYNEHVDRIYRGHTD